MCFSATASFTASAALGVVGIATLAKVKNKRDWPLAFIPLIFALQQLLEGWLWAVLPKTSAVVLPLTYVYLFFAFLWWPIYVPAVVYLLEKNLVRKIMISILFVGGIIVGAWQYWLFTIHPAPAQILGRCLNYHLQSNSFVLPAILYLAATIGSCLVSSRRLVNLFGIITAVSAAVAWWFYFVDFASVWCFFAAVLSLMIYYIL